MLRAYSTDWDGSDALPALDREELHHLVRVRRVREGETVEILNGRGGVAQARVVAAGPRNLELALESRRHVDPPQLSVHLLVAMPKGKTFPALLHKAVELGVGEITPLVTDNTEADPGRAADKRDRWESVLVEAVKQSGNPWTPQLHVPANLDSVLAGNRGGQRLCAALQPDARPLWSLLGNGLSPSGNIEVFVGPEGDFTLEEYARLREAGCHFATLGPLVLKVETAASLVAGTLQVWAQGAGGA